MPLNNQKTEKFSYDVFISHSSKDKPAVRELAQRLKANGLRVWFDEWEVKPGDMIGLKIEQGLEQSRTLVLVMSANAFASDWVMLERHTAMFRDPTNPRRRFIPLRLDDAEIKDTLRQFSYVDWREKSDEHYKKLLTACQVIEEFTAKPSIQKGDKAKKALVLTGHKGTVSCVAVTPDGKRIVSSSEDKTLKVWDLESGQCVATFEGHSYGVNGVVVTPDGKRIVSSSEDKTLKVWDLESGICISSLKGHSESVGGIAITPDGKKVVSGSNDKTLKLWDLESSKCLATLEGHTDAIAMSGVALTPDGRNIISGSYDHTFKVWDLDSRKCITTFKGHNSSIRVLIVLPNGTKVVSSSYDTTLKVWDLESGQCLATFEGHTEPVFGVAITPDGKRAVSGSADNTLKVWDLESGQCLATFEGHTECVFGVAITPDGKRVVSGSRDNTVRVWELPDYDVSIEHSASTRYTNAKVALVGETGVGKTGLTLRLCNDRWEPTESTQGMLVSQLKLPSSEKQSGMEREIWLWDFAGQPDYRLIHQLYMDEIALGLLVFDPQDDNPFEDLGHWEKALLAAAKYQPAKLLVAARCDRGGITISNKHFGKFCEEHGFAGFLSTSAKTGEGCEELKAAIARNIPWDRLPWTATTSLFKTLKDAIIKFKDEGTPLVRLPELRQRLQFMLPVETFDEKELRAVVGLMQGQGVVQMLNFGDFLLLQPELINRYASVVVRMAREHTDEMGIVPEQQVLDARLDYKDTKRLSEADEKILLRAMVHMFLDRALCLREQTPRGTLLVFPSYFRRDKPDLPEHPKVFVIYGFSGALDVIYSTLVVKLSYSDGFKKDQLWKKSADFKTHEGKRVGLAMNKKTEGAAEIEVYFEAGVPDETKVIFIKYVHEHLLSRAQDVTRVRHYICPNPKCAEPVENIRAIMKALENGKKDITCQFCYKPIPLFDLIEQKFASNATMQEVRRMDETAHVKMDNESRELILIGHAFAIASEAGQIFRPYAASEIGIDAEIEFKDYEGKASGKRIYLQLKSNDLYLSNRNEDGVEVFTIKNPNHILIWQQQAYPVMLVIRTLYGSIQWMDISAYLIEQSRANKSPIGQIVFQGEPFTAFNLQLMRDRLISPTSRNLYEQAKAEREAEEANEYAKIGMQHLAEGMLDVSMAEFEQSLSKDPTNKDALEGLLTIASSLSANNSFDRMDLVIAILSKVSPAWLAGRLCENIKLLDVSMGQLLTLRLRMAILPVTSIAAERNEFGWEVQLTSISANEKERKALTLPIKAERVDHGYIQLVADTADLPWGLYLMTVRFLEQGREHWRADQSLSNAEPKNPYIAGPPIRNPVLFFGRNKMLKDVMDLLESYSVILLGPRRSGKTSFLYQLADVSRKNWTIVPIDLHSFVGSSTSEMISGLRREVYHTCLPDLTSSPPPDIQGLMRETRNAGIKKILILLDEMAVLTNHPQVALQLRAMSKWQLPETRIIVAGTASDLNRVTNAAMDIGSPPFNEYARCELEEISRQDARDLLEKPVIGFYRYEVDALEKLLELGGGRPFFLNFLGKLVLRFVQEDQGRIIRVSHVESAHKEASFELERWFQEFMKELEAPTRSALPNLIQDPLKFLPAEHAEALRNAGLTFGPRSQLRLCPLFVEWLNLKSRINGEL